MLKLAIKSLANRKTSALLTVIAIAVSVALLLAVERVKEQVQANFANTVSGTDLIVGPRSGDVQLLLASVFHIGALNNSMSWRSYEELSQNRQVKWSVPISLGDSVSGMPVVATTVGYFQHFKYANQQSLQLLEGDWFKRTEQAVLGADAAEKLGYAVGDQLIIAHGTGGISFSEHSGHPIDIVGILKRTGTPVDQSVYVDLETLEGIHGGESEHEAHDEHHDEHADHHHPTDAISAALVGLKSRQMALFMQRDINTAAGEPLTALMPGQTLQQLWKTLRVFEQALNGISAIVVVIGLLGMLTILLASLRERSREMAVLRAVGAGPGTLFTLLVTEAVLLTIVATASGLTLLYILQISLSGIIQQQTGLLFALQWPTVADWWRMLFVVIAGFLMSLVPAWRAYRQSLADGLTVKV
ncbi:putative ABC transport system permease protein [Idiomarina fontislapidosi]|uniref:ABC transporter permease n=1 Tax=Idiomarina fontislapidosi TaxID=263723 RepID=A0A432Y846_9GAMM|nr:ABC transporter permease [Idiomarina fontislapidosi]PYE33723.1 putative ABC transport system permease protein [Idiomarina fontislapidosi]RUO57123.1 ABC transporter permease [Idiomarina fontislapidosi]